MSVSFHSYGQYPGAAELGGTFTDPSTSGGANAPFGPLQDPTLAQHDQETLPPDDPQPAQKGTVSVAELQHPLTSKARTLISKAQNALHAGKTDDCFRYLDEAMKVRSAEPYVHGVRGAALLVTGRIPEAVPELEQAVQVLPIPANYSNLGYAYLLSGRTDEGAELVRRAAANPDAPLQTHYLIGLLQLDTKVNTGDPCADLERAQNLMPAAHIALAVCYAKDGQKHAAEGQIETVLGPRNESYFEFWKKWVARVASQPAPAAAFGLHLKMDSGTKF